MGFDGLVTKGWQVHDGKIRHIDSWLSALGDEPICARMSFRGCVPSRGTVGRREGLAVCLREMLDGVAPRRNSTQPMMPSEAISESFSDQYWVNADGQLVQHRLEFFTLWQSPAGDVQWGSPELERQTSHGVMVMQFLEVGEPNTITAPVLGE